MPRNNRKIIAVILILSAFFLFIKPRVESNVINERDFLDFDGSDDPLATKVRETASANAQYVVGVLDLLTRVATAVFITFGVAALLGLINGKRRKRRG